MTWQESLRQLDARLAKGEISANEYRKNRDEILAEASSGSVPQQLEDLWAPAPAPAKAAAETKAAESNEANPGETTIVVEVNQTSEEEETQVVPAVAIPAQSKWATTAPPEQPAQQAQPMLPAPPMPLPPQHMPQVQNEDVFAVVPAKRGGSFVRFLVPLLILAVVGAGVWWFVFRDNGGDDNTAGGPSSSSTAKAPTSDEIAGKLPELPGKASATNGTLSVDRARELKLFTPTYSTLLADNGAKEIVYRGAVQPGFAYMIVASPLSAKGADKLVQATTDHLERAGFATAAGVAPDGPPVITRTDQSFRTFIAIYRAGDVWVQLNVSGPPNGDENVLRTEFERVLGAVTERLPAD